MYPMPDRLAFMDCVSICTHRASYSRRELWALDLQMKISVQRHQQTDGLRKWPASVFLWHTAFITTLVSPSQAHAVPPLNQTCPRSVKPMHSRNIDTPTFHHGSLRDLLFVSPRTYVLYSTRFPKASIVPSRHTQTVWSVPTCRR